MGTIIDETPLALRRAMVALQAYDEALDTLANAARLGGLPALLVDDLARGTAKAGLPIRRQPAFFHTLAHAARKAMEEEHG